MSVAFRIILTYRCPSCAGTRRKFSCHELVQEHCRRCDDHQGRTPRWFYFWDWRTRLHQSTRKEVRKVYAKMGFGSGELDGWVKMCCPSWENK